MRSMYEKFMTYSLIRAILLGILGLFMLIFPEVLLSFIVFIIAGYLIFNGILSIINFVKSKEKAFYSFDFIMGCLLIVMGIVTIVFSTQLVSILPIFLGVLIVIGGAAYFANALSVGPDRNWVLIILSALIIIGGIVVIFNPFTSLLTLFRIFGVLLLASCAEELISYFAFRKDIK